MSNPNKNKGKGYERSLAENLQMIFNLPFRRVPNSGAYVGGKNIIQTETLDQNQINILSGDIIPPQQLNHCDFECKFYQDIGKISSWFEGNATIDAWIKQASTTIKPYWFLCFKLNRIGEFVVFKRDYPVVITGNLLIYNQIYFISRLTWDEKGFFTINKEKLLSLNPINTSNGVTV